jgi:hypothetical protein
MWPVRDFFCPKKARLPAQSAPLPLQHIDFARQQFDGGVKKTEGARIDFDFHFHYKTGIKE